MASLIAGILITFLITYLISRIKKPKLEIGLVIGTGTQRTNHFDFYCINTGSTGLMPNQIQWQIYFETIFNIENQEVGWMQSVINGKSYNVLNGVNSQPCFPDSSCSILSLSVVRDKVFPYSTITEVPFYYSFSTIDGQQKNRDFWKKNPKMFYNNGFINKQMFKISKISI
ncbi:hypothetical protein GCM10011425_16410 [Mucilaginibacter galii]|uniref:Uncharacterized protein n=2 Tax=Mucilaginibacter galii TaxID=2005073 RepID=A0A917JB12_9SPHI|nr:hypothetical protein GCM10011425_16410 [Mucilaginibacter galii]